MAIPEPEAPFASFGTKGQSPLVARRVLPNGLTLLIQEDWSHPLVALHATVRTGSASEGAFLGTGVSHLVEHMLFKGTARRPVGAFERQVRSYGGTTQGFTSYDTTSYQIVVNKEFWSEAADLLIDALFSPSLDPEEFVKERQVVLRELKLRKDDPGHVAWDLLLENAYRVHPYRVPIIGYEPLLTRLTQEDAFSYHQAKYLPNAIALAVVGSVKSDQVLARIQELTEDLKPGKIPPFALPEEPLPVAPREITQEADIELSSVAIGFPSVPLAHPDLYPLDLLAWILGGTRGSRLDLALKEKGIVHTVSCSNYTPLHRGLFILSMRLDPEKVPQAIQGAFEELAQVREILLDGEELEKAKRAFLREYLASRQTVSGQASDLAGYEVLVGDPTFSSRYIEKIQRVRPEEIQRVAQEYLKTERATTVRLFPKGKAPSSKGVSPQIVPEPGLEKVVLENGVRVILRKDPRLPLVSIQVSLLGGIRYETEDAQGVSQLTSRMWLRGTRSKSALEITGLIKAIGGDLSPFSGRNSLGLALEILPSELPKAVDLIGEMISDPSFPSEELEKEKRLLLAELKAREEEPFSWGLRRLFLSLFTVHPYRWDPLGDPKSVAQIKRQDLVDFSLRIQDPERIVVSVVGDFERQQLLGLLGNSFGRLPRKGKPVSLSYTQEPPLISLREHLENVPRREALVMIGFPGLSVADPRAPHLDLLETVLSGGAGRLFTEVRDRRGLSYTVGAFALHGIDPGAFVLYAVTEPQKLSHVRGALLEEIRRLREVPVPKEELIQAQQGLLGARRIARQAFSTLASQTSLDELYGLGYDFSEKYEAVVKSATSEDLKKLAGEFLDPQRCVVVIGLPSQAQTPPPQPEEEWAKEESVVQSAHPKDSSTRSRRNLLPGRKAPLGGSD